MPTRQRESRFSVHRKGRVGDRYIWSREIGNSYFNHLNLKVMGIWRVKWIATISNTSACTKDAMKPLKKKSSWWIMLKSTAKAMSGLHNPYAFSVAKVSQPTATDWNMNGDTWTWDYTSALNVTWDSTNARQPNVMRLVAMDQLLKIRKALLKSQINSSSLDKEIDQTFHIWNCYKQ